MIRLVIIALLTSIVMLLLSASQLIASQKYEVSDNPMSKKKKLKEKIIVYQATIVLKDKPKRVIKGYLYDLSDSSLFIIPVNNRWRIDIKSQPVEIPFARIELVRIRKKKIRSKPFLVGAFVATLVTVPTLVLFSGGYIGIQTIIFYTIPAAVIVGLITHGIASIWTKVPNITDPVNQEFLRKNTMVVHNVSIEDLANAFGNKRQ